MKYLAQFVSTMFGMATGGSVFVYASRGDVSWWFVVMLLGWVLAIAWYAVAVMESD